MDALASLMIAISSLAEFFEPINGVFLSPGHYGHDDSRDRRFRDGLDDDYVPSL